MNLQTKRIDDLLVLGELQYELTLITSRKNEIESQMRALTENLQRIESSIHVIQNMAETHKESNKDVDVNYVTDSA